MPFFLSTIETCPFSKVQMKRALFRSMGRNIKLIYEQVFFSICKINYAFSEITITELFCMTFLIKIKKKKNTCINKMKEKSKL